jgi:hypothetical protein
MGGNMADRHEIEVDIDGKNYKFTVTDADNAAILAFFFYTEDEREKLKGMGGRMADSLLRKRMLDLEEETRRANPDLTTDELNDLIQGQIGESIFHRANLDHNTRLDVAQRLEEIIPDCPLIWFDGAKKKGAIKVTIQELLDIVKAILAPFSLADLKPETAQQDSSPTSDPQPEALAPQQADDKRLDEIIGSLPPEVIQAIRSGGGNKPPTAGALPEGMNF